MGELFGAQSLVAGTRIWRVLHTFNQSRRYSLGALHKRIHTVVTWGLPNRTRNTESRCVNKN